MQNVRRTGRGGEVEETQLEVVEIKKVGQQETDEEEVGKADSFLHGATGQWASKND